MLAHVHTKSIVRESLPPKCRASCVLQGAFAEAQALFLHPAEEQVRQLASVLAAQRMGVVAHFYMDPEVLPPLLVPSSSFAVSTDCVYCQPAAVRL